MIGVIGKTDIYQFLYIEYYKRSLTYCNLDSYNLKKTIKWNSCSKRKILV